LRPRPEVEADPRQPVRRRNRRVRPPGRAPALRQPGRHRAVHRGVQTLLAPDRGTGTVRGLRCPSEVLSLKWEHVNFGTARMTVPSCKTEHHPGKDYRTVPIFAELRPYLEEAFELAADGAE